MFWNLGFGIYPFDARIIDVRKDFWAFALLAVLTFAFWNRALFNFFAQDDFILINQFSQNNLLQDIQNAFGLPSVTHWRPIHNLYFFIAGNLFGKNYFGYHILTFLFHIGASFLIYKTVQKIAKNPKVAITASFVYAVHPANFVSFFWISGGATMIGFFLLISSFYSYLISKKRLSLILFTLGILASEAMVVGLAIFAGYELLFKRGKIDKLFLTIIGSISVIFLITRFALFTSKTTFDVYQLELSIKVLPAIKYYLSRIASFAEISGDQIVSWLLLGWLTLIVLSLIKTLDKKQNVNQSLLSIIIIIIGLFPFILIPRHLSPHYMNVSIFGFAIMIGLALKQLRPVISFVFLLIFLGIAVYNINLTKNNSWVINRSNLARIYIEQIEVINPPPESELVFTDNKISTSQEAYISLGTGDAIKFFFPSQNYETCFSKFNQCLLEESNAYVVGN